MRAFDDWIESKPVDSNNTAPKQYTTNNPESSPVTRRPPQDIEAERGVLGSMLLSSNRIPDVIEKLSAESFYRPAHQLIYRAIIELSSDGVAADALLVANRLQKQGDIDRAGGAPYIHTLVSSVPTAANLNYYADIVAEKAILRGLVDAGTRIAQIGYDGEEDGSEIDGLLDEAQRVVYGIGQGRSGSDYQALGELVEDAITEMDEMSKNGELSVGSPTGFVELDKTTNGLHGGQMIIVAARPGVGKSTLAMDFMRATSIKKGTPSVIFSLEMSKMEIVQRILSAEASVRLSDMRAGRLNDDQWQKLSSVVGRLSTVPLYIDDSPTLTMMEIRSKARRLNSQLNDTLGLVVVDYMQLLSSGRKVESRQQEVSEFSRQLKLLAKELDVPVVAISQLNRGPESRTDKKPQLADLRESGSLEQDADIVMLLYRPDSQDKDSERAGEADIIIAKHRGGPIDTIAIAHQLQYSRFANLGTMES